jgi:hypothetical protein
MGYPPGQLPSVQNLHTILHGCTAFFWEKCLFLFSHFSFNHIDIDSTASLHSTSTMLVDTSTSAATRQAPRKKSKPRKKTAAMSVDHDAVIASTLLLGGAEKVRSPNFAPWEDLLLSKAWVSVSMDPSVGCNQKRDSFLRRVEEKFNLLYAAYEPSEDEGVKAVGGRTAAQLDNRFNKNIRTDIVLFNKYFTQIHIEKPSGVPFKHHVVLAMDRFMSIENRVFKFESCVPVLHKVPKYNPFLDDGVAPGDSDEENEEEGGVNRIRGVMGNNLVRPPGRKATKAAEALARRRKATGDKENDKAAPPPAAKDIIAHSFSSVAASLHSKAVFDKKKEMVKMYRENGMAEEATEMIAQMSALIRAEEEQMLASPPVGVAAMMMQMFSRAPAAPTPTTPALMTPIPCQQAARREGVAPPSSASMETEEDGEEENDNDVRSEEEDDPPEEEEESQWLLRGREHLRRRSAVSSLPPSSRLPPDEPDDEITVVPTQQQRGRVTPSPLTTVTTTLNVPTAEHNQGYCDATQWGSQDTSFTAALSAIAGGPPSGLTHGEDEDGVDGLLYDGPDSNPIIYGPDSQDDPPSRFKRDYYRRGRVFRRA